MNTLTAGPSPVLFIRSVRLSTEKMEELHELLTQWVRKLDRSDVCDKNLKEMWITREKVNIYQSNGEAQHEDNLMFDHEQENNLIQALQRSESGLDPLFSNLSMKENVPQTLPKLSNSLLELKVQHDPPRVSKHSKKPKHTARKRVKKEVSSQTSKSIGESNIEAFCMTEDISSQIMEEVENEQNARSLTQRKFNIGFEAAEQIDSIFNEELSIWNSEDVEDDSGSKLSFNPSESLFSRKPEASSMGAFDIESLMGDRSASENRLASEKEDVAFGGAEPGQIQLIDKILLTESFQSYFKELEAKTAEQESLKCQPNSATSKKTSAGKEHCNRKSEILNKDEKEDILGFFLQGSNESDLEVDTQSSSGVRDSEAAIQFDFSLA